LTAREDCEPARDRRIARSPRQSAPPLPSADGSSGLSDDHRRCLALGGKGFLLGDGRLSYGRLSYGRETIVETYYTAQLYRGVFAAAELQLIACPGYNRDGDRGPAAVGSLRLRLEL
jgi:hypothetical protein